MLNKKSVDDLNVKGRKVLVRCDFNVPLQDGVITDENRIVAALPTIEKLIKEGAKVILCSHLGKVKNGPNEGESLAPVAARLEEKLGKKVVFVSDYHVTGEAATKAVAEMNELAARSVFVPIGIDKYWDNNHTVFTGLRSNEPVVNFLTIAEEQVKSGFESTMSN